MFEKFLKLFTKESLLDQAYDTTITMLKSDVEMFQASINTLRKKNNAELPFDIYEKDREINKYQREVRRNVLTHLTVSGVHNASAGLALVSIVIDVERIGDFTKNITELAQAHPERLDGGLFEGDLVTIEDITLKRFDLIIKALSEPDIDAARRVMSEYRDISKKCDKILDEIITEKDKSLTVHDAVVLALYFRYLKRIAAHLVNIASSVVNPFPRIGFRDKTQDK